MEAQTEAFKAVKKEQADASRIIAEAVAGKLEDLRVKDAVEITRTLSSVFRDEMAKARMVAEKAAKT